MIEVGLVLQHCETLSSVLTCLYYYVLETPKVSVWLYLFYVEEL